MVRRTVLEQVGLMDEDFFMYMEEIDWCYRIKQAQVSRGYEEVGLRFRPGRKRPHFWKIFCLPAAKVIHHGNASAGQFREETFYQLYKSRNYFYKKHYSYGFQVAARWLTRLGLAVKFVGVRQLDGLRARQSSKLAGPVARLSSHLAVTVELASAQTQLRKLWWQSRLSAASASFNSSHKR